ncbi:MAG: PQQ-binding-like beta-propeller repeat protein [Acidobacteriota bacterium]
MRLLPTLGLLVVLTSCGSTQTAGVSGEDVYNERCASCHNSIEAHAPMLGALKQMSATRILRALDFGVMMSVANPLDRPQREAVAKWIGTPEDKSVVTETTYCADRGVQLDFHDFQGAWSGWSPNNKNARFHTGLRAADIPKLKLKWAFGFEGDTNAFGAPSVVGGLLFVGSAGGSVYALDRNSGCVKWLFQADGPVRTAPAVTPFSFVTDSDEMYAVMFGDQIGWFYCLDAKTGKLLWKKKPEAHESTKLTGSPAVHDGIVYVPAASWEEGRATNSGYACCTFRGSVTAFRIQDGTQVWKTFMIQEEPKATGKTVGAAPEWGPSGAGIWSAPTIDVERGRLYVTTGNNYSLTSATSDAVVALELTSGKIVWSKQLTPNDAFTGRCAGTPECGPDYDFGSSVILRPKVMLVGQKSGNVFALDPEAEGKILWQQRVGKGGTNGGVQWGMAADDSNVYAAVSDVGRIRSQNKNKLDPRPNPVDPAIGGGLTALRIRDGNKTWFAAPQPCDAARASCSPAQPAAVTAIPGAVLAGSVDGHLRAYSTKDGKTLWDFDTTREWQTVNGVKANGGAIDGAGPVVAQGMLFQQSGYSRNGGAAGNVLLAWGLE